MSIKRYFSIFVCFIVLLPSLAKIVSANEVALLCLNSGIGSYYASVSKAAFDMVNVVFQDHLSNAKQTAKKEVPPKPENETNQNGTAIITDNSIQKTFKASLVPVSPLYYIDSGKDLYVSKMTGVANTISLGWMILLLAMLILSVRKKDGSEISLNDLVNINTRF